MPGSIGSVVTGSGTGLPSRAASMARNAASAIRAVTPLAASSVATTTTPSRSSGSAASWLANP
jgi:hypothetical protein